MNGIAFFKTVFQSVMGLPKELVQLLFTQLSYFSLILDSNSISNSGRDCEYSKNISHSGIFSFNLIEGMDSNDFFSLGNDLLFLFFLSFFSALFSPGISPSVSFFVREDCSIFSDCFVRLDFLDLFSSSKDDILRLYLVAFPFFDMSKNQK